VRALDLLETVDAEDKEGGATHMLLYWRRDVNLAWFHDRGQRGHILDTAWATFPKDTYYFVDAIIFHAGEDRRVSNAEKAASRAGYRRGKTAPRQPIKHVASVVTVDNGHDELHWQPPSILHALLAWD
jgi:hypothetical protein